LEKTVILIILLIVLLMPVSIATAIWLAKHGTLPSTENTWTLILTFRLHAVHDPVTGQYVDDIYAYATTRKPTLFDKIGLTFTRARPYPLGIGTKEATLDITLEVIKEGMTIDSAYKEFKWEVPLLTKGTANFELNYKKVLPPGDYKLKIRSMNAEFEVEGYRVKEVYFKLKLYENGKAIINIDADKTLEEAGIAQPPGEGTELRNIECTFKAYAFSGTKSEVVIGYKPPSAVEAVSASLYVEFYRVVEGKVRKINMTFGIAEGGTSINLGSVQEGSSVYLRFYKEVGKSTFSASKSVKVEDLVGKDVYAVIKLEGADVAVYLFIDSEPADKFEARAIVGGKVVSSASGSNGYTKLVVPWEYVPCDATIEVEYIGTEHPSLVGKKLSKVLSIDRIMDYQVDFTLSVYSAIAVSAAVGDNYVSAKVDVYKGSLLVASNYTRADPNNPYCMIRVDPGDYTVKVTYWTYEYETSVSVSENEVEYVNVAWVPTEPTPLTFFIPFVGEVSPLTVAISLIVAVALVWMLRRVMS